MKTAIYGHPKPSWYRTRSNPHNKRGGQRARDKPVHEPVTGANTNVLNEKIYKSIN